MLGGSTPYHVSHLILYLLLTIAELSYIRIHPCVIFLQLHEHSWLLLTTATCIHHKHYNPLFSLSDSCSRHSVLLIPF